MLDIRIEIRTTNFMKIGGSGRTAAPGFCTVQTSSAENGIIVPWGTECSWDAGTARPLEYQTGHKSLENLLETPPSFLPSFPPPPPPSWSKPWAIVPKSQNMYLLLFVEIP